MTNTRLLNIMGVYYNYLEITAYDHAGLNLLFLTLGNGYELYINTSERLMIYETTRLCAMFGLTKNYAYNTPPHMWG